MIRMFFAGIIAFLSLAMYNILFPDVYEAGEDEIALRIRMDTAEDIGLLVYDYNIDGHDYGGGISNADRSMIGRDDELIIVWTREELRIDSDPEKMTIAFRIITEYFDPNYENEYPEEYAVRLEPFELDADFGHEYCFTITGSSTDGYVCHMV